MENFYSQNVTPNNRELIETLNEETCYLRNENITKTYIIKSLTENQTKGYVKATTTPRVHQQDTAIQTDVTPKTWPQERKKLPKIVTILVKVYQMRMFVNQEVIHHCDKIKKTYRKRP